MAMTVTQFLSFPHPPALIGLSLALLALVRHAGGGVGGGIAVHILNNSPLLLGAIALAIMGVPG